MHSPDTKYCCLMTAILSRIAEMGNTESGEHVLHISALTRLLLRELARERGLYLSEEEIALVGAAASLHDIGKLAVPSDILNKPGRLTDAERAVMQTHTTAGAAILEGLPMYADEPFVRCARDICRWHHERYDGGGYPDGLRGDAIPLAAQIVSVADAYDALTSRRCYKEPIAHSEAIDMLRRGECGALNPWVLAALVRLGDMLPAALAAASVK